MLYSFEPQSQSDESTSRRLIGVIRRCHVLITHVQVVNFDGTQMIEGVFARNASNRRDDGRLVVKFLNGQIVNCNVQFDGQNPVRYIED